MRRRDLLAATGGLAAGLSGCLSRNGEQAGPDDDLGDGCSPADHPLSERLTDDAGGRCHDRAEPSLVVANEREEAAAVDLELESGTTYETSLSLAAGERHVEDGPVELTDPLAGTVTVDGDSATVAWPARSCLRHAIAIGPDGVETGWIEPMAGPGDTQHDCYAGDDVALGVWNAGRERTVTITVEDRCTGETRSDTVTAEADGATRTDDLLVRGRDYDLEVSGDGVEPSTHEYVDRCWEPTIRVDADGAVAVEQVPID